MSSSGSSWRDHFLQEVEEECGPKARSATERAFEEAVRLGFAVMRQQPHDSKGATAALVIRGLSAWPDATPVIFFSKGRISWQVKAMRRHNPF